MGIGEFRDLLDVAEVCGSVPNETKSVLAEAS